MTTLPMDIILSGILPKLPTKSLFRFKCVSKSFEAEISSPKFIKLHHLINVCSSDDNSVLVFIGDGKTLYMYDLDSPHSLSSVSGCPTADTLMMSPSIVASCECYLLIGFGFTYPGQCLAMLNPTTRTYVKLPKLRIRPDTHSDPIHGICHCVDESNDDYKVVRFREYTASAGSIRREVALYNLRSKSWKLIEFKPTDERIISWYTGTAVLLQSHLLHMIFIKGFWSEHQTTRIGCFDIKGERWANDVLLPDILLNDNGPKFSRNNMCFDLAKLDGKLCFLVPDEKESNFDMWVMEEYGVKESWVKLTSLPISNVIAGHKHWQGISRRKNSPHELLCARYQSGELFWYNFSNKEVNELKFDVAPWPKRNLPHLCKRSLLNFPGAKSIRNSSSSDEEYEEEQEEVEFYFPY